MDTNDTALPEPSIKRRQQKIFSIISISEVAERLKENNFFIFDCTSHNSYLRHHIPGAKYIGMVFSLEELPTDLSSTVVFYDKSRDSRAAIMAAKRAKEVGYTKILVMRAGISGWINLNRPVIRKTIWAAEDVNI